MTDVPEGGEDLLRLGRPVAASESGFIVIRLARVYPPGGEQTLLDLVSRDEGFLGDLGNFLRSNALLKSTRAILRVPPRKVLEWEARAEHTPGLKPLRSLLQYWRIDARGEAGAAHLVRHHVESLTNQLRAIQGVEMARVEYCEVPPAVDESDDPEAKLQTHLGPPIDPADPTLPGGINAKALWSLGADGSSVGFVDVEYAWYTDHLDLVDQGILKVPDDEYNVGFQPHGTQVLGVVAATDNDRGVVGIAPRPRDITVASALAKGGGEAHASAILNAINVCQPGDVILLELQVTVGGKKLPVEFVDDTFDAIRLASALGMVVIEAAGNGDSSNRGIDLDGSVNLSRADRDSGAIVVAASRNGPAYTTHSSSNFGSRIDCFAPAESIWSCDDYFWEVDEARSAYSGNLDQTSGATAIIAGAAVLLQSFWKSKTGSTLSPLQMRSLLSDPSINWPSGGSDPIGVMPNLGAIAGAVLPDIYLRDDTSDSGLLPSAGSLSQSPDIIVRSIAVGNPQATFGEGSGTENNADLSEAVTAGQDHYLYGRVRNRGASDAIGVTVDLYWSEVSTLVTSDQWNLIGTTPPFDALADGALAVSNAVTWQAANIPASGHYCFVAVASHAEDRGPLLPPGAMSFSDFTTLVSYNNNVAWRNFNVVDAVASPAPMSLRFVVRGDAEHQREFTLAMDAWPVPCRRIELAVPIPLAKLMAGAPGARTFRVEGERVRFDLSQTAGLRERRVVLPAAARYDCEIILTPPWSGSREKKSVIVRQKHRGKVVGAITWLIRREEGERNAG